MTHGASSGHSRPDTIDRAAGLSAGTAIFDVRAFRPAFLEGAEACRAAVLEPADDLGLSPAVRAAIGRRVAQTSVNPSLVAEYPPPGDASLEDLANGGLPADRRLAAMARHTDMIASDPGRAAAEDLQRLIDAGLTVPQVIALSELVAFVCFQTRVAHGLALLKEAE